MAQIPRSPKYLLLLDLNGTLILRTSRRIAPHPTNNRVGKKYVYGRPGSREFIRRLSDSGRFSVCVYTSMTRPNASGSVQVVLESDSTRLDHLLTRDMCKPDPEGANIWDSMRDMANVWRRFPQHGPKDTILVVRHPDADYSTPMDPVAPYDLLMLTDDSDCPKDNEFRKFRETPDNGIAIPEFFADELSSGSPHVLSSVCAYLMQLASDSPDDVRSYLGARPFVMPPQPNLVPAAALSEMDRAAMRLEQLSVVETATSVNTVPVDDSRGDAMMTEDEPADLESETPLTLPLPQQEQEGKMPTGVLNKQR